jgi:hypothetical protein
MWGLGKKNVLPFFDDVVIFSSRKFSTVPCLFFISSIHLLALSPLLHPC